MGSLKRKLKKHTTGLSAGAAKRIAHNLSEHLMQLPLSDRQQAEMQEKLRSMSQEERIMTIVASLSPTEIKRRLGLSHQAQMDVYGFALRGGVGTAHTTGDQPADSTESDQ